MVRLARLRFHNAFPQIPEIITFAVLLMIFIMAYGVASQAIISPYREISWAEMGELVANIIFLPYWQMYGELSLDRLQLKLEETPECSGDVPSPFSFSWTRDSCYYRDIESTTL